jgi:hypothetical protein
MKPARNLVRLKVDAGLTGAGGGRPGQAGIGQVVGVPTVMAKMCMAFWPLATPSLTSGRVT